jgi:hypothetical protein
MVPFSGKLTLVSQQEAGFCTDSRWVQLEPGKIRNQTLILAIGRIKGMGMNLIRQHLKEVNQACLNAHVSELYAFGSVLTDQFTEESDVDLLVSIDLEDPIEFGENYFQLKFELEQILGRKIDLLESKAIRNDIFKKLVDQKKVLVYASC